MIKVEFFEDDLKFLVAAMDKVVVGCLTEADQERLSIQIDYLRDQCEVHLQFSIDQINQLKNILSDEDLWDSPSRHALVHAIDTGMEGKTIPLRRSVAQELRALVNLGVTPSDEVLEEIREALGVEEENA